MLFGVRRQVYGGAVYMGEGNLSLLSPRWRSNHAHCAASLGSACTHDADDVREFVRPPPPVVVPAQVLGLLEQDQVVVMVEGKAGESFAAVNRGSRPKRITARARMAATTTTASPMDCSCS